MALVTLFGLLHCIPADGLLGTVVEKFHALRRRREILRPTFHNSTVFFARDPNQAFSRSTEGIDQDSTLRISLNPSEFDFDAIKCVDPSMRLLADSSSRCRYRCNA